MIFGLVIVVLVMICGAGIDVARAVSMRMRLGNSLDAAALAVGSEINMTTAQLQTLATDYFNANYPDAALGTTYQVNVTPLGDDEFQLSVSGKVDTVFLRVANINEFNVSVSNRVHRAGKDLEVSLVLDVTGSMCYPDCTALNDLKIAAKDMVDIIVQPVQTPFYSKMAIAPYSSYVNAGTYASSVRGPITPGRTITNAAWGTGLSKVPTAVTKATPAVVTSAAHGFVNGDKIWISGVGGMTQLNNKPYIVAGATVNTFQLKDVNNVNVNSTGYSNFTSGGSIRKCVTPALGTSCQVQVTTSGAHGFVNGDWVVIKSVGGMTNINNPFDNSSWQVSQATVSTFVLTGTMPSGTNPAYPNYTAGGTAYCTQVGCEYHRFTSKTGVIRVFQVASTCVTDRAGANAFTDAPPTATPLGRAYPAAPKPPATDLNNCNAATVMPLSTDKVALKAKIDSLSAHGSTAGQLGTAWGWYLLSPNWAYLYPAPSKPAAYGKPFLWKVMILMTDGGFNTMHCDAVISQDSEHIPSFTNDADHKNCNANNGNGFTQALNICDNIKEAGIMLFTVGFKVAAVPNAASLMQNCATSANHAYLPATGAELKDSFMKIAQDITELRLSQ
jgi:Flp pilus assembly protein TadG